MDSMLRKIKPYYIRKAFRYLRHYGLHDFAVRVQERLAPEHVPYGPWFEKRRASGEAEKGSRGISEIRENGAGAAFFGYRADLPDTGAVPSGDGALCAQPVLS